MLQLELIPVLHSEDGSMTACNNFLNPSDHGICTFAVIAGSGDFPLKDCIRRKYFLFTICATVHVLGTSRSYSENKSDLNVNLSEQIRIAL